MFCYVNAISSPPSLVPSMSVHLVQLTESRIWIEVELEPPSQIYSETFVYELVISANEVPRNESEPSSSTIVVESKVN